MPNLLQLRLAARRIFDEALKAVDPYEAVHRAVNLQLDEICICDTSVKLAHDQRVYSIAIGKAAMAMAMALEECLGERLAAGLISTGKAYRMPTGRGGERVVRSQINSLHHRIFDGGHPEPNEESLTAASGSFNLLRQANEEGALVIFSISGGGSAMLESPINPDITLADLRAANHALVRSGASISEVNAVRRAFSALKGGRLSMRAPACDQISLIVSDVPPGCEYDVASGPTLSPPSTFQANAVVNRYDLRAKFPDSIVRALDARPQLVNHRDDRAGRLWKHYVLLDNKSAIEAASHAARNQNLDVVWADGVSDQLIDTGCAELLRSLRRAAQHGRPTSLISGGEFACPIRGEGIGGRNAETALRLAIEWDKQTESNTATPFVALCTGTDGVDGNSPAAGAIVDSTTISRARAIGLDATEFLNRSDSYSFFVALGDAITTGPTGTNVRDLRILLTGDTR